MPLDAFIQIATVRMSFVISETALILPLGVCDETATERVGFIFLEPILILPLAIAYVSRL